MAERDWLAEARQLLAEAVGGNDNGPLSSAESYLIERRRFLDRLHGYLAAQGPAVAEGFADELRRVFGTPSVEALDQSQLARLVAGFDKFMTAARLLATTPKRG